MGSAVTRATADRRPARRSIPKPWHSIPREIFTSLTARVRKISIDGVITTVAGNGNTAYSGDGGPAINAQLSSTALAIDNRGNLYISDSVNSRVRKVSPDGIITTVVGDGHPFFAGDGGPAINAPLTPGALAVDTVGKLYIASQSVVRKISTDGSLPLPVRR